MWQAGHSVKKHGIIICLSVMISCVSCTYSLLRLFREAPKRVVVDMYFDGNSEPVYFFPIERGMLKGKGMIFNEYHSIVKIDQAHRKNEKFYGILIPPGALCMALVVDDACNAVQFPLIFSGNEEMPLKLSRPDARGLIFLNGKAVCYRTGAGNAYPVCRDNGSIQTLICSGSIDEDTDALRALAGKGISVVIPKNYPEEGLPKLLEALVECQPRLVFAFCGIPWDTILGRLKNLEYMFITGDRVPSTAGMEKLKLFGIASLKKPSGNGTISIGALSRLPELRSLYIGYFDEIEDWKTLHSFKSLENLSLQEIKLSGEKMHIISSLTSLRGLVIENGPEDGPMKDISFLSPLGNLEHLILLSEMGIDVDPLPLAKLKNLKTLVVKKSYLNLHKKEFDTIRTAIPGCDIVGFCLGSGWILMLLTVSCAAGFFLRKRITRPGLP